MTVSSKDLYWAAGLLEGEGSFVWKVSKKSSKKTPPASASVQAYMSDRDVIEKLAGLFKVNVLGPYKPARGSMGKLNRYAAKVDGSQAIGWMMALYPLLGTRRRERIRSVIANWKTRRAHPKLVWRRAR